MGAGKSVAVRDSGVPLGELIGAWNRPSQYCWEDVGGSPTLWEGLRVGNSRYAT